MIKVFTAFAGYGTDNFALKQLGVDFECVGFSEIDKYAIMCFEKNHKGKNYGDISQIDWNVVPDFDLITGGFPCQDVSVAGKKNLNKGRTILGMELTKALKIKQPKYFLFENVKGLMSKKFENFRKQLVKSWKDCGYKIYSEVLNTKDFGIPQSRPRVFFVGIRKDIKQDFKFPEKEELKIFINDILEQNVDDKYLLKGEVLERVKLKMQDKKIFKPTNACGGHLTFIMGTLTEAFGRSGSSKEYLKSVLTIKEATNIYRKLTPKECFRLQGFLKDEINLDGLPDTQAYKLAGNGQSLNVVAKILKELNVNGGGFSSSQP